VLPVPFANTSVGNKEAAYRFDAVGKKNPLGNPYFSLNKKLLSLKVNKKATKSTRSLALNTTDCFNAGANVVL
jgi:hypothetical protein